MLVMAINVDRNQTKGAKTGPSGEYRIDFLPTGNCTVTATLIGFCIANGKLCIGEQRAMATRAAAT